MWITLDKSNMCCRELISPDILTTKAALDNQDLIPGTSGSVPEDHLDCQVFFLLD